MIGFLPRLSNKHFLILIEWLSSRTGIWRRGTNDQISGDFHACLIALRARSAHAFKKSLDFATFIRNQLLIPEMIFLYTHKIKLWFQRWCYVYTLNQFMIPLMMLCVHIKTGYDSRDDVMCTHKIRLWFQRWCYVYTQNQVMIPEMMLCLHIKSGCDSRDDVMCTHKIRLWFQRWCFVYT